MLSPLEPQIFVCGLIKEILPSPFKGTDCQGLNKTPEPKTKMVWPRGYTDTSNTNFLQAPLSSPPLPQAFISQREKNEFHFPNARIAGAERN